MFWVLITSQYNSNGYPHNICLYKEVDKKYNNCNLKTMELYDCVHVGVCAVSLFFFAICYSCS